MPYKITKLANGKYQVKNRITGRILSKGTTLKKAKAQLRAIGYFRHGFGRRRSRRSRKRSRRTRRTRRFNFGLDAYDAQQEFEASFA
jgi:hypothetical protein